MAWNKHKGSQACYHTKRRARHVIRHIERLTWETLTCKAKQRRERYAVIKPNIMTMYTQTWLHPNKSPKGMGATKQASDPKDQQATNPLRQNKQEHDKGLDLSKQAWIQT